MTNIKSKMKNYARKSPNLPSAVKVRKPKGKNSRVQAGYKKNAPFRWDYD